MTALDLAADFGLVAVLLATVNICLGLLIAARYNPRRLWPHRRIDIFAVHNATAYLLLASVLIHPIVLLFSTRPPWRLADLALPAWSPVQPIDNTIGAVGLYLIVVVVATSYFRLRLGRQRWKSLHYLAYAAGACIFIHGILSDPQLKGAAVDPFDGEKVFVELCLLVTALTTASAWRHRLRKTRQEAALLS